jgi:uncharacterized lipoprotein YmbA
MSPYSRSIAIVLPLAAGLLLGACSPLGPQKDPARFYVLTSVIEDAPKTAGQKLPDLSLGIGYSEISPYLDRAQIVSRIGGNEVSISKIDHWAEPLTEGIHNTLVTNLILMLEPDELVDFPWTSSQAPDYSLELDVLHFERNPNGDAELLVLWALRSPETVKRSAIIETKVVESVESGSTEALVSGLSRALVTLSGEMADSIRASHARSSR